MILLYWILDSCREGKLSYHVLIKNKVYFNNNKECGQFVKYLMYRFNNPQNEEEGEIIKELTWFYKGTNKRYMEIINNFDLLINLKRGNCINYHNITPTINIMITGYHYMMELEIEND